MAARKGESTWPRGQNPKSSAEPPLQIRVDKIVVVEMRIRRINAVDFLLLSWTEGFRRIEAPDALKQSLPAEDLVATGDDAAKFIGHIEDRRVAIRHLRFELEQIAIDGAGGDRIVNALEQF